MPLPPTWDPVSFSFFQKGFSRAPPLSLHQFFAQWSPQGLFWACLSWQPCSPTSILLFSTVVFISLFGRFLTSLRHPHLSQLPSRYHYGGVLFLFLAEPFIRRILSTWHIRVLGLRNQHPKWWRFGTHWEWWTTEGHWEVLGSEMLSRTLSCPAASCSCPLKQVMKPRKETYFLLFSSFLILITEEFCLVPKRKGCSIRGQERAG